MIGCVLAFTIQAYNIDLDKVERVEIYRCERKNGSDIVKTEPTGRECGFQVIDGKQYWWCFIKK